MDNYKISELVLTDDTTECPLINSRFGRQDNAMGVRPEWPSRLVNRDEPRACRNNVWLVGGITRRCLVS